MNKNHLLAKEKEDGEIKIRRQHQERLRQQEKEAEKQRERLEELQEDLESALRQGQCLERLLECKEEDLISLKKKESEAQLEVQRLLKDCDMLKEKIQQQEEHRMRDEKRLREKAKNTGGGFEGARQIHVDDASPWDCSEEFQLEHIALEHGDEMIEEGKQEKCTGGIIGRKTQGVRKNPCEKARETEEENTEEVLERPAGKERGLRETMEGPQAHCGRCSSRR
ncbi:golgin subfamily A member 6-like protein 26 [Macrobrachium nipponense]|uniref:golgin subfamily A member 6-like protein 26 n=1 Tax=Macrobrachium nipponense TaxID=159736 RepID=UPI0030C8404A